MKTKEKRPNYPLIFEDIVKREAWDEARSNVNNKLYQALSRAKDKDPNAKIIWENISKIDYSLIFEDIVKREAWDEAKYSVNNKLYQALRNYKDKDPNAKIILENIRRIREDNYSLIFEDIVKREAWDEARSNVNNKLYHAIIIYKDKDPNAKIIWENISKINYSLIFEDIVKRKAWDEVKGGNVNNKLYQAIITCRDKDPNAKIIWENIRRINYSPIFEDVVKRKAWDEAKRNVKIYRVLIKHKDKNPNAKIIWENISRKRSMLSKILINIEDLAYLDKTQLICVSFLQDLNKNLLNEILNCPKGEPRIQLLKNIAARIDTESEEGGGNLDEEIKTDLGLSEEENSFMVDLLHSGFEDIQEIDSSNSVEDKVDEIAKEMTSLSNLQDYFENDDVIDYLVKSEIQKLLNLLSQSSEVPLDILSEYKSRSSRLFNRISRGFFKIYKDVMNLEIPKGYSYKVNGKLAEPFFMQKLTAYMIKKNHQFANWSETGTGKTISGVLSSRVIDAKTTLIIAVNSTISNWTSKAIKGAYPDSRVYTKKNISDHLKLDRNYYNYIVVNYEEFQSEVKFGKWKLFIEKNKIDFVILDEIQKVKSVSSSTASIRRRVIENLLNEIDLKKKRSKSDHSEGRIVSVLALSATPVINSLNEAISILSLMKGETIPFIKNVTRRSALKVHSDIIRSGIRLVGIPAAKERLTTLPIQKSSDDLVGLESGRENSLAQVDVKGVLPKIEECLQKGYLKKGTQTIVYTELVTNVIDVIKDYLQEFGIKVGEYTGRNADTRDEDMKLFLEKKIDVLISSKPISTGVDGLQTVCSQIIILVPAWTYSEYHQLVGRINRTGTVFDEVRVIIPTIEYVNEDGDVWSLDNNRLTRIWFKKSLADTVMSGNIPDSVITEGRAKRLAEESLSKFIGKVNSNDK